MSLEIGRLGDPGFDSVCDVLLKGVRFTGTHAHLIDIREALKLAVSKDRPLVVLCPHADDGAISAGCLIHEYAVKLDIPVTEVLVFAGERNVDAPWLNDSKKISVREAEFRLECSVLGSEAICWDLEAYRSPGYHPTHSDLTKVIAWFSKVRPGALIVPPATDGHMAHRMTRALAALGLLGAELNSTLILSGWTPSQVRLTDYTEFCKHLGLAYASLVREWADGHRLSNSRSHKETSFEGVELFQIEHFEPTLAEGPSADPMQVALGILNGQISPETILAFRD